MKKAVLYLRSSKDRSDVSIEAQRHALEELASTRGIVIVGSYDDAVESGKDDDRPGFQRLIADIRAKDRSWDHILVLDTARIARRRALAIIFEEHECKRRGVRIIYKSLPESDPITEMLLKSILQAMDEWHSLTSKVKGLAGMAENVRQGWRAGGRAPKGYRLQYTETGAVRDGQPVTKSKLVLADDALQVRAYLNHRAMGMKRTRAIEITGLRIPITTLIEMERNALVYAGHTVWNRTAEKGEDGYIGGSKWRPRSEWMIQRDTHEALITDEEAEILMAGIETKKRVGGKPANRVYLLAGIMFSPDGTAWNGDGGTYRLGKGVRVQADSVETAIVSRVVSDLQSESMAKAMVKHYQDLAKESGKKESDTGAMRRRLADIDKKSARLADLMSETSAPGALLRQIEALEEEREKIQESLDSMDEQRSMVKAIAEMTVSEVRRITLMMANRFEETNPESLRDALRQTLDRVELNADSFEATISYRLTSAPKSGEWLASPRGFDSYPAFSPPTVVLVKHNRRSAL